MRPQLWATSIVFGLLATPSSPASADQSCRPVCQPACAAAPAICMVERTVLVPQMFTELRKVQVTECRAESQTRKVTVCKLVEEKKEVPFEYIEWKSEMKTRQESFQVLVPEWKDITTEFNVMVSHTEKRQGSRKVARCVPTTEKQTVCEYGGHWEDRQVRVQTFVQGCDACGRPTCCPQMTTCVQRIWIPEVVRKQIDVTVNRIICEDQPYEYEVTVCKPEKRTCTQRVCTHKSETRTRDVQYTVSVPEKKIGTRTVVCCKPVTEEKEVSCTVMVPYKVEREIQVCVCRMVEKRIHVPTCCPQRAPTCAPVTVCCTALSNSCCRVTAACCKPTTTCCTAAPVCCR